MASDPLNPFGLPGFHSTAGGAAGNPLVASLEMMRRAMSSFGQSASLASDSMAQSLNPEDLEKRITELRAVENWLKLNLSMLGSSIQGLEVQLATIKTLRSFVEMGHQAPDRADQQASPLEVVLGLKKSAPTAAEQDETAKARAGADRASTDAATMPLEDTPSVNSQAAQAWWDMLQNQFTQMAQATTQAAHLTQQAASPDVAPTRAPRSRKVASRTATKTATQKSTTKATKKPRP